MVRAIFEGAPGGFCRPGEDVAAMAGDTNRPDPSAGRNPGEAELADRLRRLEDRLEPARADDATKRGRQPAGDGGDPAGLAKAMRLSTEFVAGVIAGAFLGWLADRMLGTSPWGLIVLLMLGFLAGVMNVMRAAGMLGGSPPKSN
jgi:ATP synthase protein I